MASLSAEDIFEELDKYGEIENLNICDNLADHMVGSVYAKFKDENDAARAMQVITILTACPWIFTFRSDPGDVSVRSCKDTNWMYCALLLSLTDLEMLTGLGLRPERLNSYVLFIASNDNFGLMWFCHFACLGSHGKVLCWTSHPLRILSSHRFPWSHMPAVWREHLH